MTLHFPPPPSRYCPNHPDNQLTTCPGIHASRQSLGRSFSQSVTQPCVSQTEETSTTNNKAIERLELRDGDFLQGAPNSFHVVSRSCIDNRDIQKQSESNQG
ncbi:hypothetical protein E2C01_100870 [Portunus trituberculatus]|uniref:Uncharacterized protein n=1 Tax=Portunus trituberculatus TaxID=210409 RepID=A0A5B7K817_PORTR|nr:hypothetical protein [Portunus trituberculatus]